MTEQRGDEANSSELLDKVGRWLYESLLFWNVVFWTPMHIQPLFVSMFWIMVIWGPVWLRTLLLLYAVFIAFDNAPQRGGWKNREHLRATIRNNIFFSKFSEYFSTKLVKTVDLDPKRNYLFLYHPHGVIGFGANMALNSEGGAFEKVFPGVHRSGTTLNIAFYIPFLREIMIGGGWISANRATLTKELTTKEPFAKSVVLLPGGAYEALYAQPRTMKLYLMKRKGFVRLALETNCSMLPCFGFGENELFDTVQGRDGSLLFALQQRFQKKMTFSLPFLKRTVPSRIKMNVVVGAPIDCSHEGPVTEKLVEEYHARYVEEVKKLYKKYSKEYGVPGVELQMI